MDKKDSNGKQTLACLNETETLLSRLLGFLQCSAARAAAATTGTTPLVGS